MLNHFQTNNNNSQYITSNKQNPHTNTRTNYQTSAFILIRYNIIQNGTKLICGLIICNCVNFVYC